MFILLEKISDKLPHPIEGRSCGYDSSPQAPSMLGGVIYLLATLITSTIVMGIMMVNASPSTYTYNQDTCSCDCFDRRFKENHFAATKQYRHIYFNMTANTALAFMWSALHLTLLLAFVNRALSCLCASLGVKCKETWSPLNWYVLCCSSINFYGLIYGWWVMFNYVNDAKHWSDMGSLWPTQLFFSFTDFLPAYVCYRLLAQDVSPPAGVLHLSLSVSSAHVLLALWDQGAIHILNGHSLVARDIMFFVSDLAGVFGVAPYASLSSDGGKKIAAGIISLSVFYLSLKTYVGSD